LKTICKTYHHTVSFSPLCLIPGAERERDRVCVIYRKIVCVRERGVWERLCLRERVCERDSVSERECVRESVSERDRKKERER